MKTIQPDSDSSASSDIDSSSEASAESDENVDEQMAARMEVLREKLDNKKDIDNRLFTNTHNGRVHRGRKGVTEKMACGRQISVSYAQLSSGTKVDFKSDTLCEDCFSKDRYLASEIIKKMSEPLARQLL